MPDIIHRVGINSTPEKVYEAIATPEGLSRWWVVDTKGESKIGGHIRFLPEGGGFDMKIEELIPGKLIKWECVGGPDEWIGTEITFKLEYKEDQTFVIFTHAYWKEAVEFMHHCSTKWAIFLMSLKNLLERLLSATNMYDIPFPVKLTETSSML